MAECCVDVRPRAGGDELRIDHGRKLLDRLAWIALLRGEEPEQDPRAHQGGTVGVRLGLVEDRLDFARVGLALESKPQLPASASRSSRRWGGGSSEPVSR